MSRNRATYARVLHLMSATTLSSRRGTPASASGKIGCPSPPTISPHATPAHALLHQYDLGQLLALPLLLGPPAGSPPCGRRSHAAQASQDNEDRSSEGPGPSRLTTTPKAALSKYVARRDHPPKVAVPQPVTAFEAAAASMPRLR